MRTVELKLMKQWQTVWRWLPMLLWMAAMFWISHQPKIYLAPAQPSTLITASGWQQAFLITLDWDTIAGKTAHVIVYAILAFLVWRVFPHWRTVLTICIGYAFFDEFHQLFIPGRTGRLFDVLFDSIGILLVIWWMWRNGRNQPPHSSKRGNVK